jgi:hypothetical protein
MTFAMRKERELWKRLARLLEKRSGTPHAGVCTSVSRHLNLKRRDLRSGVATPDWGIATILVQREVAQGVGGDNPCSGKDLFELHGDVESGSIKRMMLVADEYVVQTFAADRSDEAFDERNAITTSSTPMPFTRVRRTACATCRYQPSKSMWKPLCQSRSSSFDAKT